MRPAATCFTARPPVIEPAPALDPENGALEEEFPGWVDPIALLERARGSRHPVLLLSGPIGHPASRYSIFACDPLCTVSWRGDRAVWADGDGGPLAGPAATDPFALLRHVVPCRRRREPAGLPFAGGAIGYLGYPLRRWVEALPAPPPDPAGLPDLWFGLYDAAVLFDHREARVTLVGCHARAGRDDPAARLAARRTALRRRLSDAGGQRRSASGACGGRRREALALTSRDAYLARVGRALDYIAAGDIYQVNLSQRIICPFHDDAVALFSELAERHPSPFSAFLDGGRFQVLSASPERFLSVRGDRARSAPIKGTRPRGATPRGDRRLAEQLMSSPKDRAENVMIADLVRNDLGRVCTPGSIRVEGLCRLESFSTVHHLVTNVVGRVSPGRDRLDVVRALFPGGSMTGAPKIRAMEVIDELEGEERGLYAGSIGYLSVDGSADFNIVIRTLVCREGIAHLRVGGGIVAESEPQEEYRESLDKARGLLEVLRADLRTPAGS
jgi:para-aminobenzoate synthetase component 1